MQETLLIVCALALLVGVCCLILLLVLLTRRTDSPSRAMQESLRRLEQKTDSIGTLAEYTARNGETLSRTTEARLQGIQDRLNEDIKYIVDSNAHHLEVIRRTVDDKLTASLDGRLSANYARICDRLEKMYESVGEMKSLSSNVADIRRVFSNVKLRGSWGEAQLSALLEQMLAPNQYARNVRLSASDNLFVDFAVLLPVKDGASYLPIDSKFPVECFERLCTASEQADREGERIARRELERAVRTQAESIAQKYIRPPLTTDFAVMYLPSEALYSEVMRLEELSELLRKRRIIACGPTNFSALLSTLQTGFRTAAIERRSGELVRMLEQFRTDFAKFAEGLEKTKRKLQEAQDAVEGTSRRTDLIGRRLNSFRAEQGELPEGDEQ